MMMVVQKSGGREGMRRTLLRAWGAWICKLRAKHFADLEAVMIMPPTWVVHPAACRACLESLHQGASARVVSYTIITSNYKRSMRSHCKLHNTLARCRTQSQEAPRRCMRRSLPSSLLDSRMI